MSVDDADKVNEIGVNKTTGETVESGVLLESCPAARDKGIRIHLVCKFGPDEISGEFLRKARSIVHSAGFSLTWQVPNKPMHATCEDARA